MEKERNSNIELLRIILMLMVILLHFNNGEMGGAFNLVNYPYAIDYYNAFIHERSIDNFILEAVI